MSFKRYPDIYIRPDYFNVDVKALISILRPHWDLENLKIKKQTGGLSNVLYSVRSDDKIIPGVTDILLVRLYGEMPMNRDQEMENMSALAPHQLAATVWGQFANGCCYQFIHGRVLNIDDASDDNIAELIVKNMVQIHTKQLELNRERKPIIFSVIYDFVDKLPDSLPDPKSNELYQRDFPRKEEMLNEAKFLQEDFEQLQCPVTFCHNDLVLTNVILSLDKSRVHFIDFEYSNYNFAPYDLGHLFNEFAGVENVDYSRYPNRERQLLWIRKYLEHRNKLTSFGDTTTIHVNGDNTESVDEAEVERWYEMVNKCALMSHLFFASWSIWQFQNAAIDFAYLEYAVIRWNEYKRRKSIIFCDKN